MAISTPQAIVGKLLTVCAGWPDCISKAGTAVELHGHNDFAHRALGFNQVVGLRHLGQWQGLHEVGASNSPMRTRQYFCPSLLLCSTSVDLFAALVGGTGEHQKVWGSRGYQALDHCRWDAHP